MARPGHECAYPTHVDQVRTVRLQEAVGGQEWLETRQRRTHRVHAIVGVNERRAAACFHEPDRFRRERGLVIAVRHEQPGHRVDQVRQTGAHPADGVGHAPGSKGLQQVVRRLQLEGGRGVVRVSRGEDNDRPREGAW